MTNEQTSRLMSSIYEDLHRGLRSWEVWKEIRIQLSSRSTGHFEFFEPVQVALMDSVILAISRVFDEDNRTLSIPNLLAIEARLVDSALTNDLHQLLGESALILEKVKQRRDQHIAHQDRIKSDPSDPLVVREIDEFIESLVEFFIALGGFLQDSEYVFNHDRMIATNETYKVMEILQTDWEKSSPRKPRLEIMDCLCGLWPTNTQRPHRPVRDGAIVATRHAKS